jgi:cation transport regulator ChaC
VTWHFAYGSNMDSAAMRRRCPDAVAIGTGRLTGWRFIIMHGGYASIVPDPGASVYGVLWRVMPRDLAALHAYEALDSGLYRRRTLPVRIAGRNVATLVYVGHTRVPGKPRLGYQDGIVIPSARDWRLPEHYIAELARWALPTTRSGLSSVRERTA